ncbi:MAG: DUF799 family lipoprotein [Elusimicrobia bacterium]|nr:DUF799 family lipoprotein [Elusimicrobiota bacterium]
MLVLSALAWGCASRHTVRYVAPDYAAKAPPRVAVLPFDNRSVDLLGPEILRKLVHAGLAERGYEPVPLDAVDAGLDGLGIHEGGQLAGLEPGAVAEALSAEGLLYGTVEEFTMQNVGFVVRRAVRLSLRLVLAPAGERLWEDTGEGMTGKVTLDKKEAQRTFIEGVLTRGLENLFHTPLMPESKAAVRDLFSRLPRR